MNTFELHHGDCLEVLRGIASDSIDAIVTDPPYGLSFMGKRWDYDVPSVEIWAECLRVLKPGGHLLAFAGTRTQHRMAVRIEDAGFEIRDLIAWVYGSGFPKSHDVSKAIDKAAGATREVVGKAKGAGAQDPDSFGNGHRAEYDLTAPATNAARQWAGWGTALKPALEPITVARKPLIGTVVENVLAHGTGGINVDGCRVASGDVLPKMSGKAILGGSSDGWDRPWKNDPDGLARRQLAADAAIEKANTLGRWPANLIHDGSDEVLAAFPQAPGQLAKAAEGGDRRKTQNTYGVMARWSNGASPRADSGSAARFFKSFSHSEEDSWAGIELPPLDASTAESSSLQQRQAAVSALALVVRGALPEGLHCAALSAEPSMSATASELRLIAEAVTTAMPSIVSAFLRGRQHERLFLTLNHVSVVAQKTQIDTMTITASLSKSDGSVVSITFSIMPSNLVAGEKGCEQSPGRFMYCAKASKKDRGEGNAHPTVKPTDLMRYLCRLVTPPGGVVLDPFTGSGSTGKAAMLEGFRFIGIEREAEYVEIARARIEAVMPKPEPPVATEPQLALFP